MYTPKHFVATEEDVHGLLRAGRGAHWVTPTADGLAATFVPVLWDEPP